MSVTAAFVGATGGAGTTRLTVEAAATLARAGEDVAVSTQPSPRRGSPTTCRAASPRT